MGQNADVVALDDVFTGEDVAGVLASTASGRLVLATTDWSDSFALIDFLSARPGGRQILADRLRLVIQQRMARFAPDAGADEPEAPITRPVFEVLLLSDALRDALRAGAPVSDLRALAVADGHKSLGEQLHALLQPVNGLLGTADVRPHPGLVGVMAGAPQPAGHHSE